MLTRRGWSLLGAAVGLALAGRLVGLDQLVLLGTVSALAVGLAALVVLGRPIGVEGSRAVHGELQVGTDARAEIELRNAGRRSSPTLLVTEFLDDGRRAVRFAAPPLPRDATTRALYRVPTGRRGEVTLGPLTVTSTDPLGLVERVRAVVPAARVLVRPRVHAIAPPSERGPSHLDRDAVARRRRPQPSREFFALRPYETGDDLRRVHWRSTARTGDLVVRQDEAHHRTPLAVWLDVRSRAHDHASFERAVEAAASIVVATGRSGRPVRLVTSAGTVCEANGRRQLGRALDELALVRSDGPDDVRPPRVGPPEGVVAVLGSADDATLTVLRRLVGDRNLVAIVVTGGALGASPAGDARIVCASGARPFDQVWQEEASRWSVLGRSRASYSAR